MTENEPVADDQGLAESEANAMADGMEPDETESDAESVTEPDAVDANAEGAAEGRSSRRQVAISVRSLVVAAVIVAFVGIIGTFGWLYFDLHRKFEAQTRQAENNARAEKIALDYAVNAAAMNSNDINAWKVKLVAGTTPELKDKLTKAATSMEQLLVPLQWTSTAKPLVSKVRSGTGGTYVVDAFVSVMTKTVQAPEPLQSTATYSVTVDSNDDWKIADVGGIGAAVGDK